MLVLSRRIGKAIVIDEQFGSSWPPFRAAGFAWASARP
jgi:hypothetical protein